MPAYAILGGTGSIGSELVELLAPSKNNMLHIYVRSKAKLLKTHPALEGSGSPHKIFEGSLKDTELFAKCLRGTDVVFSVVGTNANNPQLRLAQDSAAVIIDALSKLRDAASSPKDFKPPIIVFVTSAGMARDVRVHANFPGYLHSLIQVVGKYIYLDFKRAVALFQKPENLWVPVVFLCSPGIMPGPSQGEVRVTNDVPKKAPIYVTYPDLAKSMIIAADDGEKWLYKEIGVVGAKMPPIKYGTMFYYFATGLMCVWVPPLWRIGHRRGWWGDK